LQIPIVLKTRRIQRALPWLILAVGLSITFSVRKIALQENYRYVEDRFHFRANEMVSNLESRLTGYKEILLGARGLFMSSNDVSRDEFKEYVKQLDLPENYPGIQGLGFSLYIKPHSLDSHISSLREQGFKDYQVKPAGRRDIYTSIIFLEPFDWRNQRAFGYDMFSEPVRRTAMQRALDENKIIASGKVTLIQETQRKPQPGFLMYLPVYQPEKPHTTLQQRRENIIGWVYAPFRMHDLMLGVMGPHFGETSSSIGYDIYDGSVVAQAHIMYDYRQQNNDLNSQYQPVSNPMFSTVKRLSLGERQWSIVIYSLPSLEARLNYKNADYIAIFGTILSALLAFIMWLLLNGSERANAKANEMTRELRVSEQHTKRLNRDLKLLSECNLAMLKIDTEHALLQEICRLIVDEGGYLMAWVGNAEHDEDKTVKPLAEYGFKNNYLQQVKISWGENEFGLGPTGTAIRSGVTDINQDYLNNPRMTPWREKAKYYGFQSSIAIPLSTSKGVFGALTIYAAEPFVFSPDEVKLLEELANDLSYGMETLRTRAEHKLNEEKIAFLAYHDALTQLPNRTLLRELFSKVSLQAKLHQHQLALALLDLDNFRHINETLGHSIGDALLVHITERLCASLAETEIMSRLNGDKFVFVFNVQHSESDIQTKIQTLLKAFNTPFEVEGNIMDCTASIGVCMYPDEGQDLETLIRKADIAISVAKETGGNTHQFFTQKMHADAEEKMQLMGQLHNAIKNQQLSLHYQAQVDIAQNRIIGFEALLRWQHPVKGNIPPALFVTLAERNGLIVPIGDWVIHEACRQAKAWLDAGQALVVAVNLSAIQIKRGNLLQTISSALQLSGLPPQLLELELTESILLQDEEAVMQTLGQLKKMGIKLSIDDFGTGYSSLSYLKRLAVDKLKIDQSFVRDINVDSNDAAIVTAIIQVAHALQLRVIAEGVESAAQMDYLKQHDCDEIQGYYYAKPLPPDEINTLLAKNLA
jgi:diguanylate cyclase (GGDEF)-like protein